MSWWSMRAVYAHGRENGMHLYEERILLFRAEAVDVAFVLAEAESKRYLQLNPTFQRIGDWIAFEVHEAVDLNGTEVWSELSSSDLEPTNYYGVRYSRFELEPDTDDTVR